MTVTKEQRRCAWLRVGWFKQYGSDNEGRGSESPEWRTRLGSDAWRAMAMASVVAASSVALSGCVNGNLPRFEIDDVEDQASIVINFSSQGSTVPPPVRRDVELRVAGGRMLVTVTSYGKTIVTFDEPVTQASVDAALEQADGFQAFDYSPDEDCTGSVSNELSIETAKGKTLYKRTVVRCGEFGESQFAQNQAIGDVFLDLLGDRETAFKVGQDPPG